MINFLWGCGVCLYGRFIQPGGHQPQQIITTLFIIIINYTITWLYVFYIVH